MVVAEQRNVAGHSSRILGVCALPEDSSDAVPNRQSGVQHGLAAVPTLLPISASFEAALSTLNSRVQS
jgi:hypothetical protein